MKRIQVIDISEGELPLDICWHNLKVADELHNLTYFICASSGWLSLNPSKTYQDLEKELREKNFNTHLIAVNKRNIPGMELMMPDGMNAQHECIFSCRPTEYALRELLQHSGSYDENFKKLMYAGSYRAITDINNADDPHMIKFDDNEKNKNNSIMQNKKKIMIETVSVQMFFDEITNKCQDQYGKPPTPKMIAMNYHGGPIMGFFVGDALLSNIGFSMRYGSDGHQIVEFVNLQNL